MKTINSPVRRQSYDDVVEHRYIKPKTVAKFKQIARKRERARLKTWCAQEMTQLLRDLQAEKLAVAKAERESAYRDLINRLRSSRAHAKRVKQEQRMKAQRTDWDLASIPEEVARVEIFIQRMNYAGSHEIAVLASCSVD
jgi:hypothetical protein